MTTVNNSEMSFALDWYQGDTSYAFFPSEMYIITDWSGRRVAWPLSGDKAVRAVQLMAVTQDLFIQAALNLNLFDLGYGVTGVCDDSCAVVELVMVGETLMYPLMIQKQLVVPEILSRIYGHKTPAYEGMYYDVLKAVNALTPDWAGLNPTALERAAVSIVWPEGKEPWECVVEARKILKAMGAFKNVDAATKLAETPFKK